MHAITQDIPVFVDLNDDEEISELVELFAAMQGFTEDQYHVVHTGEREVYEPFVSALQKDGCLLSVDERSWVLSFDPDRDPTISIGEASYPKALRVIRVNHLH
jgi:hypothetical protein